MLLLGIFLISAQRVYSSAQTVPTAMECLIGIKFDSFVILAHDNFAGRSVVSMKQDQNKLFKLDENLGMVVCGEAGDTVYFGEYIQKNIALYRIRNGYSLCPQSAASFTRNELAEFLRRNPFLVNLLIGGHDSKTSKTHLYWMDYLGTMADVPYGAHGYGSYFVLSLLDRHYHPDMTREEGKVLIEKCFKEIQKRLVINLPTFSYYIIDEKGFSEKQVFSTLSKEERNIYPPWASVAESTSAMDTSTTDTTA